MTSEANRQILASFALELLPPRVQKSLMDDEEFVNRWSLETIAGVRLGENGFSFDRDFLYRGIREAIRAPGHEVAVEDDQSVTWRVQVQKGNGELSFGLENDEKAYKLSDHSGLAGDHCIRTGWFQRVAHEMNLEKPALQEWKTRIEDRPLSDDEFAELKRELELTPNGIYRKVKAGLLQGGIGIQTLVPSERRYYERLVGAAGTSADAASYVNSQATRLIDGLRKWDRKRGFLMSLLTCSSGSVSASIRIDGLSEDDLLSSYEWIASEGDPISQIGAVEVALRNIENNRKLEPFIEQIVEGFIADDPVDGGGSFSILSSMVVLVASELGRRGTMKETKPYYRRHAAIAQASLIIRALKDSQTDISSMVKWAKAAGAGHIFFLQGLVDLRLEPRWLPDFVTPEQLRAEFIGRVWNAAAQFRGGIQSESLRRLVMGEDSPLGTAAKWPFPMLPGPLEGELISDLPDIPEEVLEKLAAPLKAESLGPDSFARIVNSALIYNVPKSQAELVAEALRRVRYSIESSGDENSILGLILSLATLAAVTRATDLAETIRVLARVMRRRKLLNSDPEHELRISMMAAASHEDLEDWACFAGEWLTELAFEVVEKESARRFLLKLRNLVQIEPALARHCAMADAAIASVAR